MISKLAKNETGFSLIEVMVSLGLFSVVSAVMASSFVSHLKFNTLSDVRTAAATAAQQVLDEIRVLDPGSLPSSGSSAPKSVNVGERNFLVTTYYCPEITYCTSASIRHLRLGVSYEGETQYEVDTVYTRLK